ncbi:vWA domain-containing protein [Paraliomyxa miuraensis]|uniref:vWA domain-containing protein n=1 Tax=Paraliomyxa miuraensis TaxID=376150 RepID=UPI0022532B3C|nr:VWA domain-containing protein [Paraliomyxa miuraensis]MCX4247571.1 VWA domain-containing protein [Paraliomyxa miuraensis]
MSLASFRPSTPLVLAMLAVSAAGCSSTDDSDDRHPGYADGGDYDPSDPSGDAGDEDEPAGTSGGEDGDDGAGPDEPPPEPDDDGIDNASEEQPLACDAQTDVTLFLSPDDSNSMSSPVQVREAVLSGWGSVQSVAIRTWEFFNYYDFGYPAAEPGGLVVTPSLAKDESGAEGDYLLQIGISSEQLTNELRPPMNLTLVLDTSGSMAGTAMDMLKETGFAIAASLNEGDTVSMVTWSTENAVVLGGYHVSGPNDPLLLAKLDELEPGGGTDLHGGLVAGYGLAEQVFAADRINRIVLISDGGANAGITDIDLIAEQSGTNDQDGIYMVGVGVGDASTYHDDLMDAVTDAGKGASVFIATEDEAWSVFHDDFISTLAVAARDVQVQLDMPPGFEIVRTSAEEISTNASEVEPQHLAPNDAMVFHQQLHTCAPELATDDAAITVTVRWRDAVTFEPRELVHQAAIGELLAAEADGGRLLKGAAVYAYAESLKAYKRADADGRTVTVQGAFAALEQAEAALPGDTDLAEIRSVLEALME